MIESKGQTLNTCALISKEKDHYQVSDQVKDRNISACEQSATAGTSLLI